MEKELILIKKALLGLLGAGLIERELAYSNRYNKYSDL